MTNALTSNIRASRLRVARSRGALSGIALVVLGAWAALVPFFGTYINLGTTPNPDDAWNWTAARGWLEVLPGAAAVAGGLLLLVSANRLITSLGGWLAAAAGAWLVVGPSLASVVHLTPPTADLFAGDTTRALTALFTFFAIGGATLLFAALTLGRLSVHGIGDVRAAEKRARVDEQFADYRGADPADRTPATETVRAHSGVQSDPRTDSTQRHPQRGA